MTLKAVYIVLYLWAALAGWPHPGVCQPGTTRPPTDAAMPNVTWAETWACNYPDTTDWVTVQMGDADDGVPAPLTHIVAVGVYTDADADAETDAPDALWAVALLDAQDALGGDELWPFGNLEAKQRKDVRLSAPQN